ncbi:Sft1p ASCRUDRAFT_36210, partial [Ascoidea rubescens DSM 1968]
NNVRFEALASKLSTLRSITEEIHHDSHQDANLLDNLSNQMNSLVTNIKASSTKLSRLFSSNTSMVKMVGIALFFFFLVYTLYKLF